MKVFEEQYSCVLASIFCCSSPTLETDITLSPPARVSPDKLKI